MFTFRYNWLILKYFSIWYENIFIFSLKNHFFFKFGNCPYVDIFTHKRGSMFNINGSMVSKELKIRSRKLACQCKEPPGNGRGVGFSETKTRTGETKTLKTANDIGILEPRNRQKITISGPKNSKIVQQYFWTKILTKWCNFWPQKLDFWFFYYFSKCFITRRLKGIPLGNLRKKLVVVLKTRKS